MKATEAEPCGVVTVIESPEAASGTRTVSLRGRGEDDGGDRVAEENLRGFGEAGQERAAVQDDFAAGQGKRWLDGEDDGRFWTFGS